MTTAAQDQAEKWRAVSDAAYANWRIRQPDLTAPPAMVPDRAAAMDVLVRIWRASNDLAESARVCDVLGLATMADQCDQLARDTLRIAVALNRLIIAQTDRENGQ